MKDLFGNGKILRLVLLMAAGASAGPWATDLREDMSRLPWVIAADVTGVEDGEVTGIVRESYLGDSAPGDTVRVSIWEMGSSLGEYLQPGEEYLMIPNEDGDLQIIGAPKEGFWLLMGSFDFNAFWVYPGVLSDSQLQLLCQGDSLPERSIDLSLRFAGRSDFMEMTLQEHRDCWTSSSPDSCLDGLRLERSEVILGGQNPFPFHPQVEVRLHSAAGDLMTLSGRISAFDGESYLCNVYPTAPMIPHPHGLVDFMGGEPVPEPLEMDIQLHGVTPRELGLSDDPHFVVDRQGRLHLTGVDGLLDITALYISDPAERPAVGFDESMTCSSPLYFTFQGLPDGPSGHLATDIIDALAKGTVTGTVGLNPNEPMGRFQLFRLRD